MRFIISSIFLKIIFKASEDTILFTIADEGEIYLSSVTFYELLMGATTRKKIRDIELLTDDLIVLSFNEEVAQKASEIYHQLRKSNKMIEGYFYRGHMPGKQYAHKNIKQEAF